VVFPGCANVHDNSAPLPVEGADRRIGKRTGICQRCKVAGERRVRSGVSHSTVASAIVGTGSGCD
jgi:hypothetical protein